MSRMVRRLTVLVVTVAALLAVASPAWAAVIFDRTDFTAGNSPKEAVIGDFNEDGEPDVATTSDGLGGGSAAVILSDGRGGFGAPGFFGVAGNSPRSIRTADLDKDGHLDLFTANGSQSSTVSVLFGNGDGTFQPRRDFAVQAANNFPTSAVAADFNGDGLPDLAASSQIDDVITILLNDGNRSFTSSGTVPAGGLPQQLATGDFNNDGRADLASVNPSVPGNVMVLIGNGDGTFQSPAPVGVGGFSRSVATGDFNGDGNQDLATANTGDDSVSVLIGDGGGGFARTDFGVGDGPHGVTVGDFDRDGNQDLAAANYDANSISILLGDGTGSFSSGGTTSVGGNPWFLAAGDLNGDTVDDLAIPNSGGSTVSVLINTSLKADLGITKVASAPALQGEELTYELTVTNGGPDVALDARVEDPLPAGVEFVSASPGCAESSGVVTCEVGDIPDGESRAVEIVVRPGAPGEITNTATVSSRTSDPDSSNNTAAAATTVQPVADVEVTKTASADSVDQGDDLSWTIDIKNNGPATATRLRLVDRLPPNVEITEVNSGGCTITGEQQTGQTITCDYTGFSLARDQSETMAIITVKVLGAADLSNTATISAAEVDNNEANNTGTVRTTVVPAKRPPIATDDRYAVGEDRELRVGPPGVLKNDTDPEDDPLTAILTSEPTKGTLKFKLDGSFTYLPKRGFTGADSFTYEADDGITRSDEGSFATVTITVSALPDKATRLGLTAKPSTIEPGRSTTLSGRLTTAAGGKGVSRKRIVIERKPEGTKSFKAVKRVSTVRNGAFRAVVEPSRDTLYRARFAGDRAANLKPSTSVAERVKVEPKEVAKRASSISLKLSSGSMRVGRALVISGAVKPPHPDSSVQVKIRGKGSDGGEEINVVSARSVPLDDKSSYRITYKPPMTGSYTVVVRFAGDKNHKGDTVAKRFVVRR